MHPAWKDAGARCESYNLSASRNSLAEILLTFLLIDLAALADVSLCTCQAPDDYWPVDWTLWTRKTGG